MSKSRYNFFDTQRIQDNSFSLTPSLQFSSHVSSPLNLPSFNSGLDISHRTPFVSPSFGDVIAPPSMSLGGGMNFSSLSSGSLHGLNTLDFPRFNTLPLETKLDFSLPSSNLNLAFNTIPMQLSHFDLPTLAPTISLDHLSFSSITPNFINQTPSFNFSGLSINDFPKPNFDYSTPLQEASIFGRSKENAVNPISPVVSSLSENLPEYHNQMDNIRDYIIPRIQKLTVNDIINLDGYQYYIYVITGDKKIKITSREAEIGVNYWFTTYVHHPELTGGNHIPVLAAGEIEVDGGKHSIPKKFKIDVCSGHYKPQGEHLEQFIMDEFKKQGLSGDNVQFSHRCGFGQEGEEAPKRPTM